MKQRWILLAVSFVVAVGLVAIWISLPTGYAEVTIPDVSRTFQKHIHSEILQGSGSLYVDGQGNLDGEAILDIYSNKDRDHRQIKLSPGPVSIHWGGPEEWVGDLRVVYNPISVKKGNLNLFLQCGSGYSQYKRWKTEQDAAANP